MEHSPPNAAKWRRLSMNAIAIALLYGNATVVLQPPGFRGTPLELPTPAFVRDAFLITGMFSSYSAVNTDFMLNGLRTQDGRSHDRGHWIALPLRDHFTQRHGVTFTQLFAAHAWDAQGKAAQARAWAVLARKIRERHNRLHPDARVQRVQLGALEWPQDARGYRAFEAAAPDARTRLVRGTRIMTRAAAAWDRFFFAPASGERIAAFRILFALYLLVYFGAMLPHVELLFSNHGVYVPYLVPDYAPPPALAWPLFLAMPACAACMLAGYRSERAARVLFALFLYHYFLQLAVKQSSFDRLIANLLAVLCFADSGRVWGLDARRAAPPSRRCGRSG